MAAEYQILTTASAASGSSSAFRINSPNLDVKRGDKMYLRIYGTLATTTTFTLKSKAPDSNYYTTGDIISGLGIFEIPYSSEMILRLDYTNSGGSPSINASVINGTSE